jgi:hypothetical protein
MPAHEVFAVVAYPRSGIYPKGLLREVAVGRFS